jgi:hypothetical protein
MSMSWSWDQKDDQKVIAWVGKASEEALLAGNDFLVSEILRGASNFFALRGQASEASEVNGKAEIIRSWLWGIHSDIYTGTSNACNSDLDSVQTLRSVIDCFKLLNSFFDLNDLHSLKGLNAGVSLDLIIPEP